MTTFSCMMFGGNNCDDRRSLRAACTRDASGQVSTHAAEGWLGDSGVQVAMQSASVRGAGRRDEEEAALKDSWHVTYASAHAGASVTMLSPGQAACLGHAPIRP
jgi:hypothetical protein